MDTKKYITLIAISTFHLTPPQNLCAARRQRHGNENTASTITTRTTASTTVATIINIINQSISILLKYYAPHGVHDPARQAVRDEHRAVQFARHQQVHGRAEQRQRLDALDVQFIDTIECIIRWERAQAAKFVVHFGEGDEIAVTVRTLVRHYWVNSLTHLTLSPSGRRLVVR